jgi:hypothetical protein
MDRTAAMFYYYDALVQFCLDSKILAFETRWPCVAVKETDAGHLPLAVVWRQIQKVGHSYVRILQKVGHSLHMGNPLLVCS